MERKEYYFIAGMFYFSGNSSLVNCLFITDIHTAIKTETQCDSVEKIK